MTPASFTYPILPSQVAFRSIDKQYPGLTTMVHERVVADHVVPELLQRAVARVYSRHEVLRTTISDVVAGLDPSSPEFVWHGFRNVVADEPVTGLELDDSPAPPERHFLDEPTWVPGIRADPMRLPVFRMQFFSGGSTRLLRIITDHALCDRWSLFVLERDIERAYQQEVMSTSAAVETAHPFSAFATEIYSTWSSGSFDERVRAMEKEVLSLDMCEPPRAVERQSTSALIESFVVSLGRDSTARFDALQARLRTTRLAVAIAMFVTAVGAEFGWHRLALMVPHANRSLRTRGSVGLFADSQYVFTSLSAGFESTVSEVSASLKETLHRVPPPAAMLQASPLVRDMLRVLPRLAADVGIRPRQGVQRAGGPPGVFPEAVGPVRDSPAEDSIVLSTPPSFPAQPDIRLTCDFSQCHQFSVNFKVDRVSHAAAKSVAERLLRQIQECAGRA
jgi:hypothetical protein